MEALTYWNYEMSKWKCLVIGNIKNGTHKKEETDISGKSTVSKLKDKV